MLDVFTQESEDLIKEGMTHIYWFKKELKRAWLKAGVPKQLADQLFHKKDEEGRKLSKRQLMDELYFTLKNYEYNRRLEISRNFVRVLVNRNSFTKQDPKHTPEKAEFAALKLKEYIRQQNIDKSKKQESKKRPAKPSYESERQKIQDEFNKITKLPPQQRGRELEKIFYQLMKISGIEVVSNYRVVGEEIDGAIKYDGQYYLCELKWHDKKISQKEIASLYMKVEGKFEAKGMFFSMSGYTDQMLESLPKGKKIKVLLFDGMHLMGVITGQYKMQELLDRAIKEAALNGEMYLK